MKSAILTAAALAALASTEASAEIKRFSKSCERALALSAGPAYMREDAGVYTLGEKGFELDRAGSNGYVCIVVREGENGLAPQCFDEPGQAAHLPVHFDEAKNRIAGMSIEELRAERAKGFASGAYRPAPGPGVVYMASAYNYVYNGRGEQILVAPHVMYHAPYVRNEDLGSDPAAAFENPGMPFINGAGPLGFMIGFVEKTTDSSAVEKSCKGQLPDPAEWPPFPAKG